MPRREEMLNRRFGLASFRPWQREAVDELIDGCGRVLVIAPTGGGKSLCYQYPATELAGTTLVVSPLIALMDDQVRALQARGIAATYLASTLSRDERIERERGVLDGQYQLVYVAPERLCNPSMVGLFKTLQPPLVAVDEAHCISQWGHDFRPDYLRLGSVLQELRPARLLACTATATPLVRAEILDRLGMEPERSAVVLRGFARPNLRLSVRENDSLAERRKDAVATVRRALGKPSSAQGAAIIYAGTRRNTEQLAETFQKAGWRAAAYHAGLDADVRERASALFAERKLDVVVATNAFGMGIDRPDIRVVVHLRAPGSIEQYYQEVGRAGRDGEPADGLLLSGSSDFGYYRRLVESGDGGQPAERHLIERRWRLFLELMRYVEAGSCRHDFMLRYFGDDEEALGGCGHCDQCERLASLEASPDGEQRLEDITLIVRKALSGVARVRGRAGLKALASSLAGKKTQRLEQLGLTSLSTHGILSNFSETWVVALMRRLITAALVDLTPSDRPVPYLTPQGVAVMKGEVMPRIVLPEAHLGTRSGRSASPRRSRSRGASPPPAVEPPDAALFELLREARMQTAKEKGLPPYVICHDRTLAEVATLKPTTVEALGQVHGMGPARIDAHGSWLLSIVREHG